MVALKGKTIEATLKKRDANFSAFLVYGPDQGLVRERSSLLAHLILQDLSDPFNFMELSEADLKAEPGRLSDEITALSFMGGERVIRIRCSGEAAGAAITGFLKSLDSDYLKPNGIVIVEGSDLGPRSGMRKAFEKAKRAATLPCYSDAPMAVRSLANQLVQEFGLSFDNDALTMVTHILGDDRGITRSELEKLCFYKTAGSKFVKTENPTDTTITLADVKACLNDSTTDTMDDVMANCADGVTGPLSQALYRSALSGTSPIGLLRGLQRNFSRLREARGLVDAGLSPNDAMKKLRPPVFFGEQNAFRERLNIWSSPRLKLAHRLLIDAEMDAKTTGAPQREIVERTALRLARMAQTKKR